MRITVTGATGLIGTKLVAALRGRGDYVTVLSRRPEYARRMLGRASSRLRAAPSRAAADSGVRAACALR